MIVTKNLSKNFKSYKKEEGFRGSLKSFYKRDYEIKTAVDSFNLDIPRGEIVGLLGPNGAGKTTLMKMLTGIIVPSSGSILVNGHNPYERSKQFRREIALVMGQKSQLWWDIPAMDSLRLLQKYYEIPEDKFKSRVGSMGEFLDVSKVLNIHVRKLSLGERMKLELMASLLHDPKVIFLDEPTIGLDLISQENIRKFIYDYKNQNQTTIVLTSHYMADVEALCESMILILDGKKKYDGSLKNFEQILGKKKSVIFRFYEPLKDKEKNNEIWNDVDPVWNSNSTEVEIKVKEDDLRNRSIAILSNYPVRDFFTEKLPIEKVMKTIMSNPEIIRDQM